MTVDRLRLLVVALALIVLICVGSIGYLELAHVVARLGDALASGVEAA